ncbi:membrane-binding protein [Leptospira kmetyi]|uniref:membrane-binding protein n=1 Tax=Leptospira kmetyi TaxID=408139 RepID=UPI003EBC4A38
MNIQLNSKTTKPLLFVLVLLLVSIGAAFFFFRGKCDGNCKDGYGSKLYWDGKKYIGQWKDGEPNGFGVMVAKDRKIIFSGKWESGEPTTPNPLKTMNKESR